MKMITKFNPNENYMGDTPFIKRFTKYTIKKYPDLNFISYVHDWHYMIMLAQRNIPIRILMKFCYDIIYGIMGVVRGVKKLSIGQISISFFVMIILFISTPYYLYKNRKIVVDLSKL